MESKQIIDNEYRWYVLSVISGQEDVVVENLKEKIKKLNLQNDIIDFLVPTVPQKVTTKSGKTAIRIKKLYPGYVFVKCKMNEKIWFNLRNTPGVRLIIGAETIPTPLTDKEYEEIIRKQKEAQERIEHITALKPGDIVIIKGGEFDGIKGVISEVDNLRGQALVKIELLGRLMPVYVNFEKLQLAD